MQVTVQPVEMGSIVCMIGQPKPQNYVGMSFFVLCCCNFLFGLIALMYSHQSDTAYDAGDIEGARQKGKCAFRLNVAGILMTIIITVTMVMNYTLVDNN